MKSFVILVAVAISVQALSDEESAKIETYHKDCTAESGVDPKLIIKAQTGEFVDDEKLKNHLVCFAKKAGFQDDDGKILYTILRDKLLGEVKNLNAVDELIKKCSVMKSTPEDNIFETLKCYYLSIL